MTEVIKTPECDKLAKISKQSQTVGEFLEWLQNKGIVSCMSLDNYKEKLYNDYNLGKLTAEEHDDLIDDIDAELKYSNKDHAYIPQPLNTEKILAEFFNIDLKKVEEEKKAIVESLKEL